MRDIEGKQLLREMVESDDEVVVQTETVKVTYAELRKIVREALSEDIAIANEEMDAPDELVVQEDPLYPGDHGLEPAGKSCGCGGEEAEAEESMAMQAIEDEELEAALAAAEMHHDARAEGDFPRRRSFWDEIDF